MLVKKLKVLNFLSCTIILIITEFAFIELSVTGCMDCIGQGTRKRIIAPTCFIITRVFSFSVWKNLSLRQTPNIVFGL